MTTLKDIETRLQQAVETFEHWDTERDRLRAIYDGLEVQAPERPEIARCEDDAFTKRQEAFMNVVRIQRELRRTSGEKHECA